MYQCRFIKLIGTGRLSCTMYAYNNKLIRKVMQLRARVLVLTVCYQLAMGNLIIRNIGTAVVVDITIYIN